MRRGGDDEAANFGIFGAALAASVVLSGDGRGRARAAATPAASTPGSRPSSRRRRAQGISRQAISAALDGVTFDPAIIRRDSGQGVFQQGFLQFAGRMTGAGRYQNGLKQMKAKRRCCRASSSAPACRRRW